LPFRLGAPAAAAQPASSAPAAAVLTPGTALNFQWEGPAHRWPTYTTIKKMGEDMK